VQKSLITAEYFSPRKIAFFAKFKGNVMLIFGNEGLIDFAIINVVLQVRI